MDYQYEYETTEWLSEKFRRPTFIERIQKSIDLSLSDKSELKRMRIQLIQEFRTPFTIRIMGSSYDDTAKKWIIDHFEKRIETLPDEIIMDLNEDYIKMKSMSTDKGKEIVQNFILNTLELSYSLDGWFRKEMIESLS